MPDNKEDSFLGGGIKFNSAGAGAPTDIEPVADIAPKGIQPHQVKAGIIIAVIVIMAIALFSISVLNLGVGHNSGHHSIAPAQRPEQNDHNF